MLVHPGWLYEFDGGPYAVLSLLAPESNFAEGASVLAQAVLDPGA